MGPACGVGACMSGSIPDGGHNTPSDLASLSPSEFSAESARPVVVSRGATVPSCGIASVGAQLAPARSGLAGAVCAGGVAGAGGACAVAAAGKNASAALSAIESFIVIERKRPHGVDVPAAHEAFQVFR
jgi:hypothetical protein